MPEEDKSPHNWRKILKICIQVLFVAVVFFFFSRAIYLNWNKLHISLSSLNYPYLILALFMYGVSFVGYAFCWNETLKHLEKPLHPKRAVKVWMFSQAVRYVPGSVWQIFGRVYLGGKEGVSKGKVIASIGIETSLMIISSLILFIFSIPFSKNPLAAKLYWPYFIVAFACLVFLHPAVFNKITNVFVHRIDKEYDFKLEMPFSDILKLLLYYSLVWIVLGVAFYATYGAFRPVTLAALPAFTGIFAVSWMLGFLFIVAPAGLGAREIVIAFLLTPYAGSVDAIVIAVLSRLLMIFGETFILVISSRF